MKEEFKFKKSLGQNFIKEHTIIEKIIRVADIPKDSLVIEIGAGNGCLTKELSKVADRVISYEIDNNLIPILKENLSEISNVEMVFDDFLKRNLEEDIKKYKDYNIYVVANVPYYITTPIIMKLINSGLKINGITIMVQKEFAERLLANPGNREYGSLTVFINYYFDVKKEFLVSKNCFIPKPKVDSLVISFKRKKIVYQVNNEKLLFDIIRDSFQFKRKNIRNNLRNYDLVKISEVLGHYNYDLNVRSEQLPLEVFIEIANNINK